MRKSSSSLLALLIGDIAILWGSLALSLLLRYGQDEFGHAWSLHFSPFLLVFILWIFVFYIARLYDLLQLAPKMESATRLWNALVVSVAIATILFYTVPALIITPKVILALVAIISTVTLTAWRYLMGVFARKSKKIRVVILGSGNEVNELITYLARHPQLGYLLVAHHENLGTLPNLASPANVTDLVVVTDDALANKSIVNMLFAFLPSGLIVMDFASFYERITGRIPLSHISETWFLENLSEKEKRSFEIGKRIFDVAVALLLLLPYSILLPFIATAIFLESGRPIFYRQSRMGKLGRHFWLLKLRTMHNDAEVEGPQWATKNDPRITIIGQLLRTSRIDELPQLWNVLKGDLSFIGPRPERPEFIATLEKDIPFYHMRHLIRPGLSGWAQINPPYYYGTHEESLLKVQYDLFYIKHRSIGLDLSIALKTLAVIFSRLGR